MKEKKGYKSVLLIALTLLALIVVTNFSEPHPWATIADPLQEYVNNEVSDHVGFNTPWCCEWTSGLQN